MIRIAQPYLEKEALDFALKVLCSGNLAQGPQVEYFEKELASFCHTKYAIAVNSGTAALHLALLAAGIGPGDEVITTPFTFIATVNTILMTGAKPVFVDIEPQTYNLNVSQIPSAITPHTKAILSVDLYGQPADYETLKKISQTHGILLIEDACQAFAAEYQGQKAGSLGDIGVFSFYATKHISSGEGGAIVTNDEKITELCRSLRNHGFESGHGTAPQFLGYNYRMTDIAASLLLSQLEHISDNIEKRRSHARLFSQKISHPSLRHPLEAPHIRHSFSLYTLRSNQREAWIKYLTQHGIEAKAYYSFPLHMVPHIARCGYKKGDFPEAERASEEVFSIPIHHNLSQEDLNTIISAFQHGAFSF